jgi:hypothetical protein
LQPGSSEVEEMVMKPYGNLMLINPTDAKYRHDGRRRDILKCQEHKKIRLPYDLGG